VGSINDDQGDPGEPRPLFDWVSSPLHLNETALFLGVDLSNVRSVKLCDLSSDACVQLAAENTTSTSVKATLRPDGPLSAYIAFPCTTDISGTLDCDVMKLGMVSSSREL
jgi:hypothetical protein